MWAALLWLFLVTPVAAERLTIGGPFSGVNDTDSSLTIDVGEAQDALNVEVSQDAQAIKKRKGYVSLANLTTSTRPVSGAVSFKTSAGNNIKIFAHDVYVSKSVDGGAFTDIITTATAGAKWSFCPSAGKIYAFNDQHQTPWSYDGTTITYYPSMPYASLCATSVDRLLLAGTTDYPNRLYFSQSGDLTNFTTGTDPEDPGFEDIGLAGEKITALFTTQSEWLVFKTNSFTSYQGTNQFDLVPSVISERVGMIEPHAGVHHEGVFYFKDSSGKIWAYNSGTLTDLSRKIDTFVSNVTRDQLSSKNYTSKTDFDSGTYYASTGSITAGSVEPNIYTYTDTTDADFNAGTVDPALEVVDDTIYIASLGQDPDLGAYFQNIGAESNALTNWTTATGGFSVVGADSGYNPPYGSYQFKGDPTTTTPNAYVQVKKYSTGEAVFSTTTYLSPTSRAVNVPFSWDLSALEDTDYYLSLVCGQNYAGSGVGDSILTSQTFRRGVLAGHIRIPPSPGTICHFDFQENPPVSSSGTFISQTHTISAPYPHYGYFSNTSSATTGSTINFYVSHSSYSAGVGANWEATPLTGGTTDNYWAWKAEMSVTTEAITSPTISDASLLFRTTGYWESPEYNMGAMSAWGVFSANATGSWTYQIKVSTYSGGTANAPWESLTSGNTITASTGTYSKIRATNSFSAYTDVVRLNDIIYGWGSVPDKLANAFEFKGDIYFSVPYSPSMSNTRVLKLDTKNSGWSIFDIPLNAPIVIDDYVYFGSPTTSSLYQYPIGDTDNDAAINSYWKTKNFIGSDPFVEKQFNKLSLIAGSDYGSSLNVTYTLDTATSTTYAVALTSTTANFVRNNRALPSGDRGTFFNMQIGNNASNQPWSFFGADVEYTNDPWRVTEE